MPGTSTNVILAKGKRSLIPGKGGGGKGVKLLIGEIRAPLGSAQYVHA